MGTLWFKSGSIELDNNGVPADGAIANFYEGGTTTPLAVYQDAIQSTPHSADVEADGNGRWPAVFIPYVDAYDFKITTEGGTQLVYYQNIPNLDPVEASEDSVDASELIQTGDIIFSPVDETRTGFVRANGRTIGNAASGATERANADTEALFTFYWNKMANTQAPVSGGRGGSAAADFAANKTVTLLDGRSTGIIGLDDMGNSAASRMSLAPFDNGDAITPGSVVGTNTHTLTTAQIPSHLHAVSLSTSSDGAHTHSVSGTAAADGGHTHGVTDPGHSHNIAFTSDAVGSGSTFNVARSTGATSTGANTTGITIDSGGTHTHSVSGTAASNGNHTHTVTGNTGNTGSGDAHNIVSRAIMGTWFQKL